MASIVGLTLSLTACPSLADVLTQRVQGTIKIGIDLPLPARNGALLAIQEANAADNGLEGWRLQPVVVDPPSQDAESAARNLRNVLKERRVLALVGGSDSTIARAQIPLADSDSQLVVVSPTASDPCLTQKGAGCANGEPDSLYPVFSPLSKAFRTRNFFRTATISGTQGPASADYAYNVLDARKAFAVNDGSSEGSLFAKVFRQRFIVKGGKVGDGGSISFDGVDQNASIDQALLKAQQVGADLLVFGGSDLAAGALRLRMKGRVDIPMIGSRAIMTDRFLGTAGAAAEGSYASAPRADVDNLDEAEEFLHAYRNAYPSPLMTPPAASSPSFALP
jgi:ABC-type branched-subunit amino acid transport system substrate-binding protein